MSKIRKGTCGAPGPYGAHCTDDPGHQYSCHDAREDVSFNERTMRDEGIEHGECSDPLCPRRDVCATNQENGSK